MFTNLQPDRYGWCTRTEDTIQTVSAGHPEMWMFVGGQGQIYCSGTTWDEVNSNSLYLVRINGSGKVVIDKDFGQIAPFQHSEFGNLTFISRNVFIMSEEIEKTGDDQISRTMVHAFELDDSTADPSGWTIKGYNSSGNAGVGQNLYYEPAWSRLLMKESTADTIYTDNGNDFWGGELSRYPGWCTGFTSIAPNSDAETEIMEGGVREKNILCITGKYPHEPMGDNDHVVRVHRLDSNPEGIANGIASGKYYASSEAWNPGAEGNDTKESAWRTYWDTGKPKYYSHSEHAGDWRQWDWHENCSIYKPWKEWHIDHVPGWCSCDSKGNFYYGLSNFIGIDPLTFYDWYTDGAEATDPYCFDCPSDGNAYENCVFYNDIMKIEKNGLPGSGTDDYLNRKIMMYDRTNIAPTEGDGWVLPPDHPMDPNLVLHPPGGFADAGQGLANPGIPFDTRPLAGLGIDGGVYDCHKDLSHWLGADGGCHDIYGQTGTILGVTPDEAKDTIWMIVSPNAFPWSHTQNTFRNGIWVIKPKSENSQVFDVIKHFPLKFGTASDAWDAKGLGLHSTSWCAGDSTAPGGELTTSAVYPLGITFRPASLL